ncbi:MAG TPA: alpha/beta hydrolase [Jatrophihabitantaceae bacterium]
MSDALLFRDRDWNPDVVAPTLVLIPSPLLGPASWAPAAKVMERRGRQVRVPNLQCVSSAPPPYWPTGVDTIVRAAGADPVVLVPHSNSGLYMPAVLAALGDQVRGVVFVDAALPGAGYISQRDFLIDLAGPDGRLPVWTSWWDAADVATLFPDAETQARVEAEQERMPLAYWDHLPPAQAGWDRPPCAYLWFAEPYAPGAEQAAAAGWATRHVPGDHLHMLVDPDAVTDAVFELSGG